VADLRRLHTQLVGPARSAVERLLSQVNKPADQTDEQFASRKESMLGIAGPVVRIFGAQGEQASSVTPSVFDNLPERITQITFESAAALQSQNVTPLNRFAITLDFSEPPNIGEYNAGNESTPNRSALHIIGDDAAWVNGVYETVLSFVRDRRRK